MDFRHASVQFGDFRGEVAIDSRGLPFIDELEELLGVPPTHIGVGFSIRVTDDLRRRKGAVSLEIAAVARSRYGDTPDALAKAGTSLDAQLFKGEITLDRLLSYVKELHFTAMIRAVQDKQTEVDGSGETPR